MCCAAACDFLLHLVNHSTTLIKQQILKIRQMFVCRVCWPTHENFFYILRLPSSFLAIHFSLIHSSPFIQFTNRHSRYRIASIVKTFNSLSLHTVPVFLCPFHLFFAICHRKKKLKYAPLTLSLKLKGFLEPTNLLSL